MYSAAAGLVFEAPADAAELFGQLGLLIYTTRYGVWTCINIGVVLHYICVHWSVHEGGAMYLRTSQDL
jgi:hypothetical protein